MKKDKLIAIILCALVILTVVVFWLLPKKTTPGDNVTSSALITSTPDDSNTDANGYIKDSLPDYLNFNETEIRILAVYERKADRFADNDLSKSVSNRKTSVSDRLKVKLTYELSSETSSERNVFVEKLENAAKSGNASWDIIEQEQTTVGVCATRGLLVNLKSTKYLDLTAPWWPGDQTKTSAYGGKLYAVSGDASLSVLQDAFCILGNVELAAKIGYSDLGKLVTDKEWTTEALIKMNGESKVLYNEDGSSKLFITYDNESVLDSIFYGAGFSFIEKDENEAPVISKDLSDNAFSSFFDTYSALFSGYNTAKVNMSSKYGFVSNNTVFNIGTISDVELHLSSATFPVVLMPMPLLDKTQKNYASTTSYRATAFAITAASTDSDRASAVLEALASFGYRNTRDAYYKSVFTGNYLSRSINEKNIELIHSSLVFDGARLYSASSDVFSSFRNVSKGNAVFADVYTKNMTKWADNLSELPK